MYVCMYVGGECDELVMVVGHQCITLTGWGTMATTRVLRLQIGGSPREWSRG